ncbi:hypothetical protein ETN89_12455 [Photobacterium damselae subsp. damselae]|nr:hypothetical protein ETN89_12455 [Photobacterium damselae subsp. damselae]
MFNLEPLDLQIIALPVNQIILAEPRILRLLGYIYFMNISMMLNLNPWISNILIIPTTYCVSLIIISLIDNTRLKHILLR